MKLRWLTHLLMVLACSVWPVYGVAGPDRIGDEPRLHSQAETQLMQALGLVQKGDYASALDDLSDLVAARPNFRLAQLVYGELMVARAGGNPDIAISDTLREQRDALLEEARSRWAHRAGLATDGKVPASILTLAPEYRHVIVADLVNNRVYLFANEDGAPRLVGDFYATIGRGGTGKEVEGDMRTPVGVYHITHYIDDDRLPELYGVGALPVNYPNALDRKRGHTGYGIWLHGVPRATYARTPRASEGCVVIANDDFNTLYEHVTPGKTPVVMTDDMTWISIAEATRRRDSLRAAIESWRQSWQAIDTEALLAYYSPDFISDEGHDKKEMAVRKKTVNQTKTDISVTLDQMSIFSYPGEDGLAKVTFDQDYNSNNYDSESRKTQYWRKQDNGDWQIVLETEKD